MRRSSLHRWVASGCVLVAVACASPATTPAPTPSRGGEASPAPSAAAAQAPAAAAATSTTVPPPVVVKTARTQGLGNVLQLAVMRGYFREQGVELQEQEFGTAADALAPLSRGELDAGSSAPLASFFNALARDVQLTLALDATHVAVGTRGLSLIARLEDGKPVVQGLPDLRGKRPAQPSRGNSGEPALERMLAEAGLRPDDLREVEFLPFPTMLAAMGSGNVDVGVVPAPWGAIAEDRGIGARVWDAGPYVEGVPIAVIVFSERFGRERTDAARRFAVAYLRAARDYMDAMEHGRDRDTIIAQLAQAASIDPRVMADAGYLPINRNGRINADQLTGLLHWLMEHGYVPQEPKVLVDNQFADYAASALDGAR